MTEKQRGIIGGLSFTFLTFAVIALIHPSPKPAAAPTTMASPAAPTTSQPSDGYDFERARRDAAREAAFNCAVLRDAVNDARAAAANAQRYGWHERYSQGIEMERAEEALRKCEQ